MGKFRISIGYLLGLFCAAAAAVPALAGTLSVDVSPTTGYTVTNRSTVALPPKATSGPIATYNPTFGPLTGGGAYQTTSSGITITGIKGGTASTTMSGRINAGVAAMRNGLTRCLTSFRCNVALAGGAAGVQALFDGIDWIMDEGGQVQRKDSGAKYGPVSDYVHTLSGHRQNSGPSYKNWIQVGHATYQSWPFNNWYFCRPSYEGYQLTGWDRGAGGPAGECRYGGTPNITPPIFSPVPPSEIPPVVDSLYTPAPSDLPFISTGGLDFGAPDVNFEITDIPSATSDSSTFTQYPDGTSKGSTTQFDFSWSNNPSKKPNVSVDETTTETTYSKTGQPTGTTTTTTTITGGGGHRTNDIEIPTDCDFMPTVCRFLEWFREPDPELDQEVDFSQLIDTIEIERDFSVGSSTAACPAPFVIDLSWVPSVEVSLQPFCDFVDLLRPVLLAIASIFSGMIILRT